MSDKEAPSWQPSQASGGHLPPAAPVPGGAARRCRAAAPRAPQPPPPAAYPCCPATPACGTGGKPAAWLPQEAASAARHPGTQHASVRAAAVLPRRRPVNGRLQPARRGGHGYAAPTCSACSRSSRPRMATSRCASALPISPPWRRSAAAESSSSPAWEVAASSRCCSALTSFSRCSRRERRGR